MGGIKTVFTGIKSNFPPMVVSGLEDGCGVDDVDEDGFTPLILAACMNRSEIVKLLVERGANLEISIQQLTPLMITAQEGHVEAAEALINAGANVNACTDLGLTPLMIATRDGRVDFVNLLLRNNADLWLTTRDGTTVLDVARQFGHERVLAVLKEAAGHGPGGIVQHLMGRTCVMQGGDAGPEEES